MESLLYRLLSCRSHCISARDRCADYPVTAQRSEAMCLKVPEPEVRAGQHSLAPVQAL